MTKKSHDRPRDVAKPPTDTASYEQSQGRPDPHAVPGRRNERTPHERDESAEATGDRLQENPVPSGKEISQAHDDVEEGRIDTDRRGVPNDVPKSS